MRSLLVLTGLMLLSGCGGGDVSPDEAGPAPSDQAAEAARFEDFTLLPENLRDAISFRKERHDRLVIDEMFDDLMTEQELRELLLAHQSMIKEFIKATLPMSPPVPPEPEFNDEEIQEDLHLESVPVRLLIISRLLMTDAIRCWTDKDYEGCGRRYASSMRIGLCLLDDANDMNLFRGAQVCYPTIFELDLRLADGLSDHLSLTSRQELLGLLRNLDTSRAPAWDESSAVAEARRRAMGLLGTDDERP